MVMCVNVLVLDQLYTLTWGVLLAMWEKKRSINPQFLPVLTHWLSCIVGNVWVMLWVKQKVKMYTTVLEMSPFYKPHTLLPFPNLVPTLPTMQPRHWVTSLEAFSQTTCRFFWSHKKCYTTFFFTFAVVLHNTWWHALMFKIGGVTL